MPTYGYECRDCGHRFEVFQKMSDDPVSTCEKCAGQVRKVLFPVGILFKGSGFHVNDYRKPEASGNGEKETDKSDQGTEKKEQPAREQERASASPSGPDGPAHP